VTGILFDARTSVEDPDSALSGRSDGTLRFGGVGSRIEFDPDRCFGAGGGRVGEPPGALRSVWWLATGRLAAKPLRMQSPACRGRRKRHAAEAVTGLPGTVEAAPRCGCSHRLAGGGGSGSCGTRPACRELPAAPRCDLFVCRVDGTGTEPGLTGPPPRWRFETARGRTREDGSQ
jgi:hypothetical protein